MPAPTPSSLSLVIPAYNPLPGWALRVATLLESLSHILPSTPIHIVVATDGSTRGHTQEERDTLLQALQKSGGGSLHYCEGRANRGKGFSVREGVEQALRVDPSTLIIITDWDIPFLLESYQSLLGSLQEGNDVVVPTRGESYARQIPPRRRLYSSLSRLFNALLLRLPTHDTQGGMKGLSPLGAKAMLATRIDTFLYDTEFVCIALRRKLRVESVEVQLMPQLNISNMRLRTILREASFIPRLLWTRWLS